MKRSKLYVKASLFALCAILLLGLSYSCKSKVHYPEQSDASQLWTEGKGSAESVSDKSAAISLARNAFVELAKRLDPTVVNINTTFKSKTPDALSQRDELFKKFFEDFFGGPDQFPFPKEFQQKSLGSGFIIHADGYILTNNHVVEDAHEIEVILGTNSKSKKYKAKVIGRDRFTDLALIKIDAKEPLPVATLGDSDKLQVGEWVTAIGNPFGYGHTVSAGIVSAKERILGRELETPYNDYIQTDATIHPGNSGGPLINIDGEVVGINTAIDVRGAGIGFAIPINIAKRLLPQLKEKGRVTRGWIGVGIDDVTPELAEQLKLDKEQKGAIITQVFPGDPADKAGLQAYDVVVKFGEDKVENARDLQVAVGKSPLGKRTPVEVIRDGKKLTKSMIVVERKEEIVAGKMPTEVKEALGMEVSDLTSELRQRHNIPKEIGGVVIVDVAPYKAASSAGLKPGQVILEIDRRPISNLQEYNAIVSQMKPGSRHLFRVLSGEYIFVTTLEVPAKEGKK